MKKRSFIILSIVVVAACGLTIKSGVFAGHSTSEKINKSNNLQLNLQQNKAKDIKIDDDNINENREQVDGYRVDSTASNGDGVVVLKPITKN